MKIVMANYFFSGFVKCMSINFTGIKNLNIRTFKANGYGFYLNNANHIEQGYKYHTVVSLKADIDGTPINGENVNAQGYKSHIEQYFESLKKLKHFVLAQKILGIDGQDNVEIIMKHYHAPDNLGDVNSATFMINGQDVPLVHRNVLPLYSFMARVTRDVLKYFELGPETRKSVKLMNDSIAKEAEEFIENMNL